MYTWLVIGILVIICIKAYTRDIEGFSTVTLTKSYNDIADIVAPKNKITGESIANVVRQVLPVSVQSTGSLLSLTSSTTSGSAGIISNTIQEKVDFCEKITNTDCSILDDPRYAECGICHKDGVRSDGSPFRGGMFISADDQKLAEEIGAANGTTPIYKPSVGTCDQKYFTVKKDNCVYKQRTLECVAAGVPTANNQCGQCFGTRDLLYLGPKPQTFDAIFNVSHPGNGITFANNSTGQSATLSASTAKGLDPKEVNLNIKEGDTITITLSTVSTVWCAWLSSVDGSRKVSLDLGVKSIVPANNFIITGDKHSIAVNKALSAIPTWESYKKKVPNSARWYIPRNKTVNNVVITFQVPASLINPFYDVDIAACPSGPIILSEIGSGLMRSHSCYDAKGKFNPSIICMIELFKSAGGTSAGTYYPSNDAKARTLVVNETDGKPNLDMTIDSLNNMGSIAMYGIDNNGAPANFATQKKLAMGMLGLKMDNPCDGPMKATGPHSIECLDYLWRTSGNPAQDIIVNDLTKLPYAYCSSIGQSAPLTNAESAQEANDIGDINRIRSRFNDLYVRSQDSSDFDAQAAAMKSCYGVSLTAPPINETCPAPPLPPPPPQPAITIQGGYTQKTEGGRTYYTITDSTLLTVNRATDIQYFAIGGAGGSGRACGAGAGGVQTNIRGIYVYPSQYNPVSFVAGNSYKIGIGAGGGKNGGDTMIYGKGVNIIAKGGAMGGYTGIYCPASEGGSGGGGGGCRSIGLQGGSTNTPPSSPITNAGAGAGGPPPDYNNGGRGITFAGKVYGVGGSSTTPVGQANTGNGGSNGGGGGSGVVIISVPSADAN